MPAIEIKKDVFFVGALDWDRRLFDELIPLPDGTSYNSYLVRGGEKTALIDAVDPTKTGELLANLQEAGVKRIDYLVSQHAEQDHSGAIGDVLELYPEARLVTNEKCKGMLIDLLQLPQARFQVVADGDTLDLGGRTLEFLFLPWVHWPETMATYLRQEKLLFSCDFLGAHLAQCRPLLCEEHRTLEAAKRYFAEIMMPFRSIIKRNLEKVGRLDIEVIAPSHGPVHNTPRHIMDAYRDWVGDEVKNEVVLAYVSMHESTKKMVEHLSNALIRRGIVVRQFNLPATDLGRLAIALVDAATIVLGSPTVLTGAHPKAAYAAFVANALRPKTRFASVIGSFGWGGKMVEQLAGLLTNMKVELLTPVIAKGQPKEPEFLALDTLADQILAKHREIRIA